MIKVNEEALICDLAETYHIYDYKKLPLTQVAIFAKGLKSDSRTIRELNGNEVDIDTLLLASISDKFGLLIWSKTVDGRKGINRPKMITQALFPTIPNQNNNTNGDVIVFNSGEDFTRTRNKILKAGGD